jgi:hypothetical protein
MKRVITTEGERPYLLDDKVTSTGLISSNDLVVVDNPFGIGILCKQPLEKMYFVKDIFNTSNHWPSSIKPTIKECLDVFYGDFNNIWKFENRKEFVDWLQNRINP